MSKMIAAKVLVSEEIYTSLASRPDRVRECMNGAEQAMSATAAEAGRVLSETPRLVDQRSTGLGFVELEFQAETATR